jgi:hypothetical protein
MKWNCAASPLLVVILVGLCALLPGCSRRVSHNVRLQQQANAKCKECAELLATVVDLPSAKAAEPKLKAALQELAKIEAELEKSYDPENVAPSEHDSMTEEVAKGMAEMQRLNGETVRISKNAELVAALGSTWKALPSVFMLEASGAIPKSK